MKEKKDLKLFQNQGRFLITLVNLPVNTFTFRKILNFNFWYKLDISCKVDGSGILRQFFQNFSSQPYNFFITFLKVA